MKFTTALAATLLAVGAALPAQALTSEGVDYTATFSDFVTLAGPTDQATLTITIDASQNTFGAYSLQALSFYASAQPSSEQSTMTSGTGGLAAWSPLKGSLPDGSSNDCKGSGTGWCWDTTSALTAPVNGLMTFAFTVTAADGSFLTDLGPHLMVSWFGDANGNILSGHHLSANVAPVPEPSTYALMLAGLVAVGFMASRRRQG